MTASVLRGKLSGVVLAAGDRSKHLTLQETICLALLILHTECRGAVFASRFYGRLPAWFSLAAAMWGMRGLVDKGIVEQEDLPYDIRHIGGGVGLAIKMEFKV